LFGFSTNYKFALITRTLCGAVNANIGIIRSMVAEITNHSNHARAFSLLPLTMGVGTVAGPMLGALFVHPVEQFPGLFEWFNNPALTHFFQTYPYSLPCLMGSTFCLAGAIFGYFNLEETLPGKRAPDFEERFYIQKPDHVTADETTGLLNQNKKSNYGNGVLNDAPVPAKDNRSTYLAALTPDIQKVIFSYVLICCTVIMETELFALWT
jgi:MFS family permease